MHVFLVRFLPCNWYFVLVNGFNLISTLHFFNLDLAFNLVYKSDVFCISVSVVKNKLTDRHFAENSLIKAVWDYLKGQNQVRQLKSTICLEEPTS